MYQDFPGDASQYQLSPAEYPQKLIADAKRIEALRGLNYQSAVASMLLAALDNAGYAGYAAALALQGTSDEQTFIALCERTRQLCFAWPHRSAQSALAPLALAYSSFPGTSQLLISALERGRRTETQANAAYALRSFRTDKVVRVLLDKLLDPAVDAPHRNWHVRCRAAQSLKNILQHGGCAEFEEMVQGALHPVLSHPLSAATYLSARCGSGLFARLSFGRRLFEDPDTSDLAKLFAEIRAAAAFVVDSFDKSNLAASAILKQVIYRRAKIAGFEAPQHLAKLARCEEPFVSV